MKNEILCPNCRVMVQTGVKYPQDVVCNGRGEHIVSAETLNAERRAEHLRAMDRVFIVPPHDPPYHLVSGVSGKHIGPFSTQTDALLARHIADPEFQAAEVMSKIEFDHHLSYMGSDHGRV